MLFPNLQLHDPILWRFCANIYPILTNAFDRPAPREGHRVCRLVEGGALEVGHSWVEAAYDWLLVKFSNFFKKTLLKWEPGAQRLIGCGSRKSWAAWDSPECKNIFSSIFVSPIIFCRPYQLFEDRRTFHHHWGKCCHVGNWELKKWKLLKVIFKTHKKSSS